jgi:hypothetical protein
MNTTMMSSLLVAMLVAASVPVTAAERERSGANQRQQPQQQRVQQGAQHGNSARGDARQFQGQSRDAGREQHAARSGDRSNAAERQHVQRDHERQSRDVHRERNDGQRRFGHDWPRDHAGSRPNRGGQGNHYGWQGNHNGGQGSTRAFDRRYDNAQQDQRQSIQRGIRSGELTRQEASRLMTEQRRLEAQERRYLADGSLSRRERADMTQDLNRARQHIYNETHDAQERR